MKILILAQSRSGSTTLYKAIESAIPVHALWEPFHYTRDGNFRLKEQEFNIIKTKPNLLVKIIDNHFYGFNGFQNHTDLTKHFDKVIGLTRENDEENAKSYYLAERDNAWFDYTNKNQEIDTTTEKYKRLLGNSKRIKEEILSFDIFQVTYEGLYIRKDQIELLQDYLGFSFKNKISFFK